MPIPSWLQLIVIGLIAGWVAALVLGERRIGLIGYLAVGIAGSFIGYYLFLAIGFAAVGWVAQLVAATVGALVLIFVLRLLRRR